jgi:hypothetical protein
LTLNGYPNWAFAMETAVLLNKPVTAKAVLSRLIKSPGFDYDQKTIAVHNMETWMRAKGFRFDKKKYPLPKKNDREPKLG